MLKDEDNLPPGHDVILSVTIPASSVRNIKEPFQGGAVDHTPPLCFLVSDLEIHAHIVYQYGGNSLHSFYSSLFRLEIHLYSMAGIAVSFGMIISNMIVMTDHIKYHHNRKVGISLMAATLTTVGALVVIFFLDEPRGSRCPTSRQWLL